MKKVIYSIIATGLIVTFSLSLGCKKDNPISCAEKLAKYQAAAMRYAADATVDNCNAAKSAAEDYFNSCSSGLGTSAKEELQAAIDDMNCQ